jgi:hypothetical protein
MRRDDAIRLLRTHLDDLRRFGVVSLSLIGSIARDEAGPQSDLDVLVDFGPDPTLDDYVGLTLCRTFSGCTWTS